MPLDTKSGCISSYFIRFLHNESGATAIEYSLLASLVAVCVIAGASSIGNKLNNTFTNVSNQMK